jgi:glutaredoxin
VTVRLTLYSRKDCCLCDEMKASIHAAGRKVPVDLVEIDVDTSRELVERYGAEVPVLLINGRKAFKYRVTARELEQRLRREND